MFYLLCDCTDFVSYHWRKKKQLSEQNRDLRETRIRNMRDMEELKRVQELRIDEFSRRRLVENQDTVNEFAARIQELQNEVHCMNDSRDFEDAESVRSGPSNVPSHPALFPPHPDPGGKLSRSLGMPSRNDKPPDIWDTHGISGNVFANPVASSSAPYPQELNPLSSSTEEPLHSSTVEKSERRTQDQDQRCQSGPSAKIQSFSVEETLQRIMEQTNNDCRFQIFISTNAHTSHVCLLEDKIQN